MSRLSFLVLLLPAALLSAQPSRIELHSLFSTETGTTMQYNILLPHDYDGATDRYPVVYLFRGAVDEWADPMEDASRRGTIKTVYDSLYARKKIGRMILVMPGLSAPATDPEYRFVVNELIPAVDSIYRTVPTRWHRAMDGFSLGGLIVTNLLAGAPQFFCSAGSYDGTLSLFNNALFQNASPPLVYALHQIQLLYHTASVGGNNNGNNVTTFGILNGKGIFNALPSFLLDPSSQHNWYYADLHMSITLPLHWQKMTGAPNMLNAAFTTDLPAQKRSGTVPVQWSRLPYAGPLRTMLFASSDMGNEWRRLGPLADTAASFQWNTAAGPDGTLYRLRLLIAGDTVFCRFESPFFTVDNPGNGAPDLVLLPMPPALTGYIAVPYIAGDAEGDPLQLTFDLSFNGGTTWQRIDAGFVNTGGFILNTAAYPNNNATMVRMSAHDGTVRTEAAAGPYSLSNTRHRFTGLPFVHLSGNSDAEFALLSADPSSVIAGTYTITVRDSGGPKRYLVQNALGQYLVGGATEMDGVTEGPLFNGMRLLVKDHPQPTVRHDSTRWRIGTSPLEGFTSLVDVYLENDTVKAVPLPYDYEIRLAAGIVDTSLGLFGTTPQPLPFTVWNTTLDRKAKCVFVEIDMNGSVSRNDELFIIDADTAGTQRLTWHVQFTGIESAAAPIPGDRFGIRILKPLTRNDMYTFDAAPMSAPDPPSFPGTYALEQNYPNPFNPSTTFRFTLPVREKAEVTVFDLLGRIVAVPLNEFRPAGVTTVSWNAAGHASGVYYYRLRTPSFTSVRPMLLLR